MDAPTHSANLHYLEDLYEAYRKNPASVDSAWQAYFAELARDLPTSSNGHGAQAQTSPESIADGNSPAIAPTLLDQLNDMVRVFRARGHRAARVDPLGLQNVTLPELDPAYYGFTAERMDQLFPPIGLHWPGPLVLRDIIRRLRQSYCGAIGIEFMHIEDAAVRRWLEQRIETSEGSLRQSKEARLNILTHLIQASAFEEFIRARFVGAKSFSLEGGESLIVLLKFAMEKTVQEGMREIVLAMAHRGRLNVLVNVVGKQPRQVFREFIDAPGAADEGGDVKYHLGYSGDVESSGGRKLHLSLCFNPSHLEFVNPVALGRVRAKQDRSGDAERERGMALLIHGDAAFAGEGITQETLNLSELAPYHVGGTLHVIVNNQIGFTTSPAETRSSRYASDVAKMLQAPIFHVNGDDPEAVEQAAAFALDFRRRFKRDVVIDMICYRRLGHNEGDEPAFTQPVLYRAISRHPPVHALYLQRLVKQQIISRAAAEGIAADYRAGLEKEFEIARSEAQRGAPQAYGGIWAGYSGGLEPKDGEIDTAVPEQKLAGLLETQTHFPEDFHPHPKIRRAVALRREMAVGKRPLDWAAAESLAFASLAIEGTRVRLSGQDTARGTFSQRHAVLCDVETGRPYMPLQHLAVGQAPVEIYNSPLSEAGVLGFEYGYSLDYPDALVAWEAQFGDFLNAAQVTVDQFIASAEEKWRRLSGLVLLLPHAFEGMGPEHSSARLERFLQLCARDNLQVAYPTTPAQYFHALRRQVLRKWRKPLVVLTPKSLLRHRDAVSPLAEFTSGGFKTVIGDTGEAPVRRILLCGGKIYYDLMSYRSQHKRDDVAIVRVEQLYPIPHNLLAAALERYPKGTPAVWVQEEPINMGASCFWSLQLGAKLFDQFPLSHVARAAAASPATGSASRHREQQEKLLSEAFGEPPDGKRHAAQ